MNHVRRLLAFAMALVLMVGMVPVSALADEVVEPAQTSEPTAKSCLETCTLEQGHEGDCVLPRTHAEGCTLAANHEGDCMSQQPVCTKDENCTLTEGHTEGCPKIPAPTRETTAPAEAPTQPTKSAAVLAVENQITGLGELYEAAAEDPENADTLNAYYSAVRTAYAAYMALGEEDRALVAGSDILIMLYAGVPQVLTGSEENAAPVAKIGDTTYTTLEAAFAAVNGYEGTETITLTILAGTHSPTGNEQLNIKRSNVLIEGESGAVIDCLTYSCSGQAGVFIGGNNVTVKNLTVTCAGNNVDAIKVSNIDAEGVLVTGVTLENLTLSSTVKGHGLNLHGVQTVTVSNVTASGTKCGISMANAAGVTVTNTGATGNWGSIGMMYKADSNAYANPVTLTLGAGNTLGTIYSERPGSAGLDTIHFTATTDNDRIYIQRITVADGVNVPPAPAGYKWENRTSFYTLEQIVYASVGDTVSSDTNPLTAGELVDAANKAENAVIEMPVGTNKLPAALTSEVEANADADVKVSVPVQIDSMNASVTFDKAAVSAIAGAGADVTLSVTAGNNLDAPEGAAVYDITLSYGENKTVSDFQGGTATVELPAPNVTEENKNNWTVYHYGTGKKTRMENVEFDIQNKKVTFDTGHFSAFSLENVDDAEWYKKDPSAKSFTISTDKELFALATLVNEGGITFEDQTITLAADIALTGQLWPGIGIYAKMGGSAKSFKGTFDGNSKTISGVTFADNTGKAYAAGDPNNYRGFFNQIEGATVKNLTVTGNGFGTNTPSGEYGGAMIVGHAYNATIQDCVADGSISGTHNVAGIVVRITNSNVIRCTNDADLTGEYSKLGGIVNLSENSTVNFKIEDCVNNGTILSDKRGEDGVGGIIGMIAYGNNSAGICTITGCVNNGEIKVGENNTTAVIGQIVGQPHHYWNIPDGNKGLANQLAVGTANPGALMFATVADGVATYTNTLAAGGTYLVTAKGAVPAITLKAGEFIAFDTTLATLGADTGITSVTEITKSEDGKLVTYQASKPTNWIQVADTSWMDAEPYVIDTPEELAGLAKLVNEGTDFDGKTVKLGANIDLENIEWTPIGTEANSFKGIFDGNEKTISNLKITSGMNYAGLFGSINAATIKDVSLTGASISGGERTGGLVGSAFVSTISGCTFSGDVTGEKWVGGLVGHGYVSISGSTVSDSSVVSKARTGNEDWEQPGGVIGFAGDDTSIIGNTVSNVTVTGDYRVGGIAGTLQIGSTISDNTVSGVTVTQRKTDTDEVGLLVGRNLGKASDPSYIVNNSVSATANKGGTAVSVLYGIDATKDGTPYGVVGTGVLNADKKIVSGTFTLLSAAGAEASSDSVAAFLAPNSMATKNSDGTYTVDHYVASVFAFGTMSEHKYFKTLSEAVAYAVDEYEKVEEPNEQDFHDVFLLESVEEDVTINGVVGLNFDGYFVTGTLTMGEKAHVSLVFGRGDGTTIAMSENAYVKRYNGMMPNAAIPEGYEWYTLTALNDAGTEYQYDVLVKRENQTFADSFDDAVTITKETETYTKTAVLTEGNFGEDGKTPQLTYTISGNAGVTIDSATGVVTIPRDLDMTAGNVTVTITATAAGNVDYLETSKSYTLTITKGELVVTATPYEGAYDGQNHTITLDIKNDAGETATGAAVTYSATENGTYTADHPQIKDVGTHTIFYKVEKTGVTTRTGSAIVKINKADQSISYGTTSMTKNLATDSAAFTNALTQTKVFGAVTYASSNTAVAEVEETTGEVTVKAVGTATITATAAGHTNYNQATASYTVTVIEDSGKADLVDGPSGYVIRTGEVSDADGQKLYNAAMGTKYPFFKDALKAATTFYVDIKLINTANGQEVHDKAVTYVIGYPNATVAENYEQYSFRALHLLSDGTTIEEVALKATEDGLVGYSTLSPFMVAYQKHSFSQTASYDGTYHWYACTHAGCTAVSGYEKHDFASWITIQAATKNTTGIERRHCKDCDYYQDRYYAWYQSPFTGDNIGMTMTIMAVSGLALAGLIGYGVVSKKKKSGKHDK